MSEAIVNEQLLHSLLNNRQAQEAFPFLRFMARRAQPERRSCCGKQARAHVNLRGLKLSLMGMSVADIAKMKKFLGVEKLVFYVQGKEGGSAKLEK